MKPASTILINNTEVGVNIFCVILFWLSGSAFGSPGSLGLDLNGSSSPVHTGVEQNFSKIQRAVVEVRSEYGYGTGTLFEKDSRVFVLTAAHVIISREPIVIVHGSERRDSTVVYFDNVSDIAVLEIEEMSNRDPIKLRFRRRSVAIGDNAGYCGFPNRRDLACFSGNISFLRSSVINVNIYAWFGASGSLVFDSRGRVIGVLSGVEVGEFLGIPSVIENVIWIRQPPQAFLDSFERSFEPSDN